MQVLQIASRNVYTWPRHIHSCTFLETLSARGALCQNLVNQQDYLLWTNEVISVLWQTTNQMTGDLRATMFLTCRVGRLLQLMKNTGLQFLSTPVLVMSVCFVIIDHSYGPIFVFLKRTYFPHKYFLSNIQYLLLHSLFDRIFQLWFKRQVAMVQKYALE